jgi:broad specificity phosphatase PhoE
MHWADARLTDTGIAQALVANAFWKTALKESAIPAPESYYASPLDRCLATATLTFGDLSLPEDRPFKPLIKEVSSIPPHGNKYGFNFPSW